MITLRTLAIGGGLVLFGMMVAMAAFYSMLVLAAEADERSEQLFELMRRERQAQWNSASCARAASVSAHGRKEDLRGLPDEPFRS
jgi:predicted lipid-binding transport protein (Tim44 family)